MSPEGTPVTELATLIRSKNAGPFVISLDFVFPDTETYRAVRDSGAISRESIAELYSLPLERVSEIIDYPAANAIKINLIRARPAGAFGEQDIYGSQQGALLDDLFVPLAKAVA